MSFSELGTQIEVRGRSTNVLDVGSGPPVMLLHGSGPGVSAWANWRLQIPELARKHRVIAFDQPGFGFTERRPGETYDVADWTAHVLGVLDTLGLDRVSLVGNSMGGGIALHVAAEHPERVNRLVLMGSVGVPFPITDGLDAVWGFELSLDAMRSMMDLFAFNRALVTDELARLRFEAASLPGVQEAYSRMFPGPRQRWVDAFVVPEQQLRALPHETLIVHGRDDRIIPLDTSLQLLELIDRSRLHVFGRCGHWSQIEHADSFNALIGQFLDE